MASGPLSFLGQSDSPLLRRSVLDDVTGNPLITSAPTGEVRQRASLLPLGVNDSGRVTLAVPQMAFDAIDYARAPARALSGELQIWDPQTGHTSDAAREAASGLAGLAMTGSMPFKAPKGAIRSFGGAAAHDDPLAALQASLADFTPEPTPGPFRVDPNAKTWDLYHGTKALEDFDRFRADLPKSMRPGTPNSEAGGVFLSPDPNEASIYAGSIIGRDGGGAGPRVMRATVDPGKTDVFDLPHLMENDPAFVARARQAVIDDAGGREVAGRMFDDRHARMLDEIKQGRDISRQLAEMGYPQGSGPTVPWGEGGAGAAMAIARERGLDTAVIRGLGESGGGDQVVALTPGRVRSYYDPDHVLYSGGRTGGLAGLSALAASRDEPPAPLPFLGRR